ncbi:hypothetical protein BDF20DRAFT_791765, partial [Mycotypha africana]|uniref:uncharacterized protein n=1 Tax=Mycotypha africana TaxID=64632 RepID=UPI0023017B75
LPSLASFIGYIIHRSHTRSSTVLGLLVFLQRLQGSLRDTAKDMPGASHRIFLATLIVASKALHDTSPKNKHWARYVKYFTLEDINSMERQILEILVYIIPHNEE